MHCESQVIVFSGQQDTSSLVPEGQCKWEQFGLGTSNASFTVKHKAASRISSILIGILGILQGIDLLNSLFIRK